VLRLDGKGGARVTTTAPRGKKETVKGPAVQKGDGEETVLDYAGMGARVKEGESDRWDMGQMGLDEARKNRGDNKGWSDVGWGRAIWIDEVKEGTAQ